MRPRGLLDRWDLVPREEIRWFQARRLREFLRRQVVPFSPHYRELFAREKIDPDGFSTLDDLRRIPFTDKSSVCATPEEPGRPLRFLLRPDAELIRRHSATSRLLRLGIERLLR